LICFDEAIVLLDNEVEKNNAIELKKMAMTSNENARID